MPTRAAMKWFHTLCVLSGCLLFAYLVWDSGWDNLWHQMGLVGWGFIPFLAIELLADLCHTLGWRACLSPVHRTISLGRLFSFRLAGYAFNTLTPTAAIGGEIVRGTLVAGVHAGPEATAGVMVDKLTHTVAQILLVSLGSLVVIWGMELSSGVWVALATASLLLVLGSIVFLVLQMRGQVGGLLRWLQARNIGGSRLARVSDHMRAVDETLQHFYRAHPKRLFLSFIWHAAGLACGIGQSWWFLSLLTADTAFPVAAGLWFLGSWFDLVGFAVPMNVGLLEGSRVLSCRLLGLPAAVGLTYGIALRLEQVIRAGIGLGCYALFTIPGGSLRRRRALSS
jgi:hypothetical protein